MYMCNRILSIDVGIKNLAFCLFEKDVDSSYYNISKWDIVNLSQEDEIQKCICIEKNIQVRTNSKKETLIQNIITNQNQPKIIQKSNTIVVFLLKIFHFLFHFPI